jgi:endo-1,4-beta-xylanase
MVNEAIEDKSDLYLRQSQWLEILGEDFIRHAFEIAHADSKKQGEFK